MKGAQDKFESYLGLQALQRYSESAVATQLIDGTEVRALGVGLVENNEDNEDTHTHPSQGIKILELF